MASREIMALNQSSNQGKLLYSTTHSEPPPRSGIAYGYGYERNMTMPKDLVFIQLVRLVCFVYHIPSSVSIIATGLSDVHYYHRPSFLVVGAEDRPQLVNSASASIERYLDMRPRGPAVQSKCWQVMQRTSTRSLWLVSQVRRRSSG